MEIGSERLNGVFIMSISVKLNKNGIKKLQKELEQEMKKRTIVREGVGLRKDSEKFLKIVLEKREENGSDIVTCTLDMFSEIPNIEFRDKSRERCNT